MPGNPNPGSQPNAPEHPASADTTIDPASVTPSSAIEDTSFVPVYVTPRIEATAVTLSVLACCPTSTSKLNAPSGPLTPFPPNSVTRTACETGVPSANSTVPTTSVFRHGVGHTPHAPRRTARSLASTAPDPSRSAASSSGTGPHAPSSMPRSAAATEPSPSRSPGQQRLWPPACAGDAEISNPRSMRQRTMEENNRMKHLVDCTELCRTDPPASSAAAEPDGISGSHTEVVRRLRGCG
jgi:hypothetical protein